MSTHPTCGEALAHLLAAYGVRHVFGIPGVHNLELYRGLASAGLVHVSPRHEQGAAFMADGYARVSRRPGVCFVITGPGLTNALTGIAQAYNDSVPMLVIAAVNRRAEIGAGRGFLHEIADQRALVSGVTAWAHRLLDPAGLAEALGRAFATFAAARPRPVYLEIPVDVLAMAYEGPLDAAAPPEPPVAAPAAIARAAQALRAARRPLVIAGGGAVDAAPALARLADLVDAPFVLTSNARGLLPPDHPRLADSSLKLAPSLLAEVDRLVAIGTELGPTDFSGGSHAAFNTRPCLRLDIDPAQIAACRPGDVALVGDAGASLVALVAALEAGGGPSVEAGWRERAVGLLSSLAAPGSEEEAQIDAFLHHLAARVDAPTIVGDSTAPVYRGFRRHRAPRPLSWFNSATGFGTLGYALPAAIGAWLGAPDRPVVALVGDGGIQFTLAELAAARDIVADLRVVVWNNRGYREIANAMEEARVPRCGVDIAPPDFAAIARAMRIGHRRVAPGRDLVETLDADDLRGVAIVEVVCEDPGPR